VRIVMPADGDFPQAMALSNHRLVIEAHRICRPVKISKSITKPITLPERVADLYLAMAGEWNLRPLVGITTAPLLSADGSIRVVDGYDAATGLICRNLPSLQLPERPSIDDAKHAHKILRTTFATFPFADATRQPDERLGVDVVNLELDPATDESTFLIQLLTACCRPSLLVAPGAMLRSPQVSGAGSGKGLLARAICAIAFGVKPNALTPGSDRSELEKRLAAELFEAHPCLFLDNANNLSLDSQTLASAITERPSRARALPQHHAQIEHGGIHHRHRQQSHRQ
jgi:hypothetical protein